MSLLLSFPDNLINERIWISRSLLGRFTDEITLIPEDRNDWQLAVAGERQSILFPDIILPKLNNLPSEKLTQATFWQHGESSLPFQDLPILHSTTGVEQNICSQKGIHDSCEADIFGMAFWVMSRWEEVYNGFSPDEHDRFPITASYLYTNNLVGRPWVDEWMHWLRSYLIKKYPNIHLKKWQGKILVSHDVDSPSRFSYCNLKTLSRRILFDAFFKSNYSSLALGPYLRFTSAFKLHSADPYNTFDWLMTESEKRSLESSFFFIVGRSGNRYNPEYKINNKSILSLIKRISERGHEIGLHTSYDSYVNKSIIVNEMTALKGVCATLGIEQREWGGRQHYLRFKHPLTLLGWNAAGATYESSLTFREQPGFRCGTCWDYRAFDPVTREELSLKIRPLILMECSIFSAYKDRNIKETVHKAVALKKKCLDNYGNFTILWHNSFFDTPELKNAYKTCIDY